MDWWAGTSRRPRRAGGKNKDSPGRSRTAALIRGDFKLPARATLEFEISWKNKPDFVFALGVGDGREIDPAGVSVRSLGTRPDHPARDGARGRRRFRGRDRAGPGRVHLLAYLDQRKGRILVFRSGWQAAGRPESRRQPNRKYWAVSRWPTSGAICGWSGCGSASGTASRPARLKAREVEDSPA